MAKNNRPYVRPKNIPGGVPRRQNTQQRPPEVKNPKLLEAVNAFKANPSADTQRNFIAELFQARLLLPCQAVKRETGSDGKQQVQLQFMLLKNKEGENIMGIFTDWDQIRKNNNPPGEAAAIPFTEILKVALGQGENIKGLILNPFEHGVLLDRNTMEKMNENLQKAAQQVMAPKSGGGIAPGTAPLNSEELKNAAADTAEQTAEEKDEILYIGEPLEEPMGLIKELARYFKSEKAVASGYFLEIYHSKSEPTPLVVIDYRGDSDKKGKIYEEIEKIYKENTQEPLKLTVMTSGEKLVKDAIVNLKPFYQKKLFGLF